jgi:ABC-type lipoprotein export system ATPase subunit
MSDKNIYVINNLFCKYPSSIAPVLHIKELELKKGKFIAVLGESGTGKSTFLETIGLMNKTFQNHGKEEILFLTKNNKYDVKELWNNKSEQIISHVRNKHFSFVFQKTNLMNNFSWVDNICITLMLQNVEYKVCLEKMKDKLESLNLQSLYKGKDKDKLPTALSGGQRQRIAFLRAILPNFTILFGDEPTGNLDEENSDMLMKVLLQNITEEKSAVIVTHNINIALKFADQILLITKVGKADKFYGKICKENILTCRTNEVNDNRDWRDYKENPITKHKIKALLKEYNNE